MNAPVQNMPIYEALAHAFQAEGVDHQFTLMGDGNMHWSTAMKNLAGHDHVLTPATSTARCVMAMGYYARDRQGRRRLGHLRPRLHADHDRADHRRRAPRAAGGVRRRGADARQMVQPVRSSSRRSPWPPARTTSPRTARSACTNMCARRSTSRSTSASRSSSACPTTCRSSRCRTSATTSPSPTSCRSPSACRRVRRQIDGLVEKLANAKCPIIIAGRGAVRVRRRRRDRGAGRSRRRAARHHAARPRHVRPQPVLDRRLGRLCARHRARARREGRSRRHDRREPDLLHCRRRQHVSRTPRSCRSTSSRSACATACRSPTCYLRADAKLAAEAVADRAQGARQDQGHDPHAGAGAAHQGRAGRQRHIFGRARPARSARRDRRARSRDPEGLRQRQRLGPPVLLPHR